MLFTLRKEFMSNDYNIKMYCNNVIIILNVLLFYTTFSHHAYWLNIVTLFEVIYKPMSGLGVIFYVSYDSTKYCNTDQYNKQILLLLYIQIANISLSGSQRAIFMSQQVSTLKALKGVF